METILAIDDELSVRESYRVILSDDYRVLLAEGGEQALAKLKEAHVDLILLDLNMPGMHGIDFLKKLDEEGDATPIVVVTAANSVDTAVNAMKLGAADYIIKPFDVESIKFTIARVLDDQRKSRELLSLREASLNGFESIIGDSPALRESLGKAQQAMNTDSTVLITGESGTGKDMLARAIHSGSHRAEQPYVPISCCAIPAQLVESELFGHEKGAFTGADRKRVGKLQVANKGTLFLDEIGEMPLDAQAKLLRVLQDSRFFPVGSTKDIEVDVRYICATNRNLQESCEQNEFREDLYYRINVIPIEMPPLRKRREDIPHLVAHFVQKHAARTNAVAKEIQPKAIMKLAAYQWPGNVRELENSIERLLVHHGRNESITVEHVADVLPSAQPKVESTLTELEGLPLERATQELERHLIARALESTDHVQSRAAEMLGTTRRILKYKMDQLNIGTDGERQTAS